MTRYGLLLTTGLLFVGITSTLAQNASADPDFMRSQGKFYVVVAVIAAIFLGITTFLIYLDRKLTKLENQIQEDDVRTEVHS